MIRFLLQSLLVPILAAVALQAAETPPLIHHRLEAELAPERHRLQARDRLRLPEAVQETEFRLHPGLTPRLEAPAGRLRRLGVRGGLALWRLELDAPARELTLSWRGEIHQPPTDRRSREGGTPGTISEEGVYLSGATGWYPRFGGEQLTFSLELELPPGWHGLGQGAGSDDDRRWQESHPQESLYLVAAPFHRYARRHGAVRLLAWLREADPGLAERYLGAAAEYLDLYSRLLGPYPYAKFALVENFWESGYGMPSFTLLGSRVIRLPFILHTSYPHEILHNWWGNSVYVDYAGGNWAEGLTSYLADHLLAARRGKGAEYRRNLLLDYASWVKAGNDLPLVHFRGRHGEASQAAGYGRMLMLAHMLRGELGDRTFLEGLRRFYRDNRFRVAGFDDLRRAFEAVSGRELRPFFRQWTRRTGAPELALEGVRVTAAGSGYRVEGRLVQRQPEPPFRLRVPLYLETEGEESGRWHLLEMEGRTLAFSLESARKPRYLLADPLFDLFRRLSDEERPPTLSALFGADRLLLVLPASAPAERLAAWRRLAERWRNRWPGIRVVRDDRLERLPEGEAAWILGRENRLAGHAWRALAAKGLERQGERLQLAGGAHRLAGHSLAAVAGSPDAPLGLLLAADTAAIDTLARKLPHYGRYSYLLFDAAGRNRLKGQWTPDGGPLVVRLDPAAPAPRRPPDHPPLSALLDGPGRTKAAAR